MDTTRRTYDIPAALVDEFERWRGKTRIQASETVSAALFAFMQLSGDERDVVFERLDAWLLDQGTGGVSPPAGPTGAGPAATAAAKGRAAQRTLDQERAARKARRRSG